MIGFETDLDDLRLSSQELGKAADAASAAHAGVRQQDVPVSDAGLAGALIPDMFQPDTAFGGSLGMRSVAAAYEEHRLAVEKMLAKLYESTEATSRALNSVARLYEAAEEDNKQRLNRAASTDQG